MRARALLLFLLLPLVGCGGRDTPADRPAVRRASAVALAETTGWYRMPAGDTALLSYSARGGLRLFSLWDTLYARTLVPGPDDTLHLDSVGGSIITFHRHERRITGFDWPPGGGVAERLVGYGYAVEPFDVEVAGATLEGSLFLPQDRAGPVPAAVMIHGSGESDRDNYWYMSFADAMVRSGLAVLLPDKRGTGLSEGDWFTTGLTGFARDAAAQVEGLRAHPAIDGKRVGVVGVSQGGRIAPMVAPLANPSFVINLSGAAVPLDEQIEHETRQDMKEDGLPGILDFLVRPVSVWSAKRRRPEWWATNGPIDPVRAWEHVAVPALTVYGREDEFDNVPVARSVARLDSLGLPNLEVRVFEGTGHGLFEPGSYRVRDDVLQFLKEWIEAAVSSEAGGP